MEKQKLFRTAAILMLSAGVFNVLVFALAITRLVDPKSIIGVSWVISPLPYFGVAAGFTGKDVISNILAAGYFIGIMTSIAGGAGFWVRKTIVPGIIGAAGALLCFPILGAAAIILLVNARSKSTG